MKATMKLVLAALVLFALGVAHAIQAPPLAVEKMVAQSEFYMHCDVCRVANDTTAYPPGGFAQFFVNGIGLIRIPIDQYRVIQNAGKGMSVTGIFEMSARVQQYCRTDWDGGVCRAARFLWKQEWPAGQCVTPDGKVYTATGSN